MSSAIQIKVTMSEDMTRQGRRRIVWMCIRDERSILTAFVFVKVNSVRHEREKGKLCSHFLQKVPI